MLSLPIAVFACAAAPQLDDFRDVASAVPRPLLVAHGDFDGDGLADVVCASEETRRIVWFPGSPDGPSMDAQFAGVLDGELLGLAVGDVDGDGDEDIVATHRNGRSVSWLKNDGVGGFDAIPLVVNEFSLGPRIYVVDFDLDGDMDVIAMRGDNTLFPVGPLYLQNTGGGIFAQPVEFLDTPFTFAEMVLFDVDGDGLRDVVAGVLRGAFGWFRNPGATGVWTYTQVENQAFLRLRGMRAVDLDGDGDQDLVMAIQNFGEFRFYENLGGGAFGPPVDLGGLAASLAKIQAVDADLDGDLDLVATSEGGASPRWIENQGGFQFVDRGPFLSVGGAGALGIDLADVNADGHLDLLLVTEIGTAEWVPGAAASPSGLAWEPSTQELTRSVPSAAASAVLDVDLDGIPDVISVSPSAGVFLASGLGGDRLSVPQQIVLSIQAASSLCVNDIDGNGTADLLVSTPAGEILWVPGGLSGGFGSPLFLGSGAAPFAVQPEAFDLDQDGDLDLLFVGDQSSNVSLYEQLAPGVFAPERLLISGIGSIRALISRDVDADGTLDLIVVDRNTGFDLVLYRGLGAGVFAAPAPITTLPDVLGLNASDLNGDGAPDLVWVHPGQRRIMRALNSGSGVFAAPQSVGALEREPERVSAGPPGPSSEATLVVYQRRSDYVAGTLEWFAVDGPTAISLQEIEVRVELVSYLALEDVNGDGDLDVLLSASNQGRVGWFENTLTGELGSRECSPAVPNSSGRPATVRVVGSRATTLDSLSLEGLDLPAGAATMFLTARQPDLVIGPGGSQGNLCLGGAIGRFASPGQITTATPNGFVALTIDPQALPQPTGIIAAMSGETWRFQAWYRDQVSGAATSNFTDAVAISMP